MFLLEAICCDTAPARAKRPEWKGVIPCSTWPPAALTQQCGDPSAPAVAAASCSLPSPSPVAETVKTTMSEKTKQSQHGLNNNNICKAQNLVHRAYSKLAHTHTHTHTHTYTYTHTHTHTHTNTHTHIHRGTCTHEHSDYAMLNLHSLKQAAMETNEDSSTEQKTWQVSSLGKRDVFRLHLNESREGFFRRGRGRSFLVEEPKTEKAREPTTESLD